MGEPDGIPDRLVGLLGATWERLRRSPSSQTFDAFERALEACVAQARAVRILTEETAGPGAREADVVSEPGGPATRPRAESAPAGVGAGDGRAREGERRAVVRFPPYRDQATGLPSREGFDATASGELKRCRRYDRTLSLMLFQLALAGPDELRSAGSAIRRTLRESDLVGRHVDRTFAVSLPETSLSDARSVAWRVIENLRRSGAWGDACRLGLAGHPLDGDTLLSLLEVARGQLSRPVADVLGPSGRRPDHA